MRHNEVVLQLTQFLGGNGYVTQRTETGGNAIDGTADVAHLAVQVLTAFLDSGDGFVAELQLFVFVEYFFDAFNRQSFMAYCMHG